MPHRGPEGPLRSRGGPASSSPERRGCPPDGESRRCGGSAAGVVTSAEATVLDSIVDQRLQRALSSLPERYRRVVLLYVDGFSYKEIAGIVGVPRGTVMSRLHRGRKGLMERLHPAIDGECLAAC